MIFVEADFDQKKLWPPPCFGEGQSPKLSKTLGGGATKDSHSFKICFCGLKERFRDNGQSLWYAFSVLVKNTAEIG